MSDGPIHVIKYSNSIQEINWLYSLFASVIPGVSTRSLDRTKLIVYTTRSIVLYFFTRNNDLELKSSRFAAVVRRSVADKQLHLNGVVRSAGVAQCQELSAKT